MASIPSPRKRTEGERKEKEREIYASLELMAILVVENLPSMESSAVTPLPGGSCFDFQQLHLQIDHGKDRYHGE